MTGRNVIGTEYGFDGSSSWKQTVGLGWQCQVSRGTQFRAVGNVVFTANSQALSAEAESALGYKACQRQSDFRSALLALR